MSAIIRKINKIHCKIYCKTIPVLYADFVVHIICPFAAVPADMQQQTIFSNCVMLPDKERTICPITSFWFNHKQPQNELSASKFICCWE